MGIFSCRTHGRQGFIEVCAEVGAAFREGIVLHRNRVLDVEVCDTCLQRHALNRFASETFPEWSDEASAQYDVLNATSECHCVECVAATELAFARNHGRPDPFLAYENTLTFLQLDILGRLEEQLLRAFDFQQSVVEPRRRAVWVRYGALTHPLTITVYYVTVPESQDAILSFLKGFFVDLPQRQYCVRFYRAESWTQSPSNPNVWSRGSEELLREHEPETPRRGHS